MAMVTLEVFRTRFPELSRFSDNQVSMYIADADFFFDPCRWDDLLELGSAYWVAHQCVWTELSSASAILDDAVMKKVGDIAKQRDSRLIEMQVDNPYKTTKYGQRYLYYMNYVGAGGMSV